MLPMYYFYCITCEWNPNVWDILDQDGRRYSWCGDLYSALREAARLERQANE